MELGREIEKKGLGTYRLDPDSLQGFSPTIVEEEPRCVVRHTSYFVRNRLPAGLRARTMRHSLGALARLLEDPPYNYGFHTAPKGLGSRIYHWHLEILPKLTSWAGFELSTGVYINVTPPEVAAASLRELVYEERDRTC
jgi:hypothetical protein